MLYQLSYGHQNEGGSHVPHFPRGVIILSAKNIETSAQVGGWA
jgi:hypothetical protein